MNTNPQWPSPPASKQAHGAAAMDLIFIEGFVGETVIGIHETELHRPQPLVIDVHAGLVRARACDTDRINDTIDYGVVCERLRRLLVEHKLRLLEAFAESPIVVPSNAGFRFGEIGKLLDVMRSLPLAR